MALFSFLSAKPSTEREPVLPAGMRVYAIGDIHGRLDCLLALEDQLRAYHADQKFIREALVVFLGDYVDRGPDSRGVIEHLRKGTFAGLPTRFLMGNHEDAMLRFLEEPEDAADWLSYGGVAALASYGVPAPSPTDSRQLQAAARLLREKMPASHVEFLRNGELWIEIGGFLFVHAGIRPGVPIERQRRMDLLAIREPFLSHKSHPWRIVHGHTITAEPQLFAQRIGLDTGAYASGKLTCAAIEGDQVTLL